MVGYVDEGSDIASKPLFPTNNSLDFEQLSNHPRQVPESQSRFSDRSFLAKSSLCPSKSSLCPSSAATNQGIKKFKKKNMPRPYSPIYTNVNHYSVTSRWVVQFFWVYKGPSFVISTTM